MPTYKYIAINESGKKVNGILSSESERAARQQIKASNLTPLSLGKTNRNHFLKVRVSQKQLLFATRQIATLLDSSISIDETLKSIALEVEDKSLSSALHAVRDEILQGSRIAEAMSSHPSIFNETYRSLVAAGDTAGNLHARVELVEGKDFIQSLREASIFPSLFLQLLSSGYKSGNLTFMFEKVAQYMKGEIESKRSTVLSLLEPLVIIFGGGIIILIVLAILLPIMQMNSMALG